MMGMTPSFLVLTLLQIFLCILMITLVVLVAWGLAFLHQQESIPNVMFLHLLYSYQYESNPNVFDSSKCFGAQIPCSFSKI